MVKCRSELIIISLWLVFIALVFIIQSASASWRMVDIIQEMVEKVKIRIIKKQRTERYGGSKNGKSNLFLSSVVGLVMAGMFSAVFVIFALPYSPGETTNPSCSPGDTNCTVTAGVPYTGATSNVDLGSKTLTTTGAGSFGSLVLTTTALTVGNGGTGQSSYTIGDLLYASGATALSKLADVATGNALISGGVGVAPSWDKIGLTTHISGVLPIANGGTNSSTALNNSRVMTSVGDAIVESGAITDGESIQRNNTTFISAPLPLNTAEGRLTLTSGTPITTSDVSGATTIYFAPYKGNRIYLYDGTRWKLYSFSELSLALGTLTNALPYDVFIYDNSGTLTLELLAWSNGTTRATALTTQNGVLVKTGATTRRYLGTFYTTSTTTTEDSATKRFLWNYYNRVKRNMNVIEATSSWTYGTASWRGLNNSTSNRLQLVIGVNEEMVSAALRMRIAVPANNEYGVVGIDLDGTSTNDADITSLGVSANASGSDDVFGIATLDNYPGIGFHFYQAMEYASTTTNITFYGTNGVLFKHGIVGWVNG